MISLPLQGVGASGAGVRDPSQAAPGQPSTANAPPDPSPQAPVQASPPSALVTAAASQGGLAPLLADLAAALSAGALPVGAQAAAEQVLGFGLDTALTPSAGDLQVATARSGLFLESDLASGLAPEGDFKGLLLDLAQALQPTAGEARATPARNPPLPPFAGGPVRGQGAVAAASVEQMSPEALAARLLGETRAALSRQTLMQSASCGRNDSAAGRATRWLFELPVVDGQSRSIAQFELSRDGRRGGDGEPSATTRARFSLDLGGLGPVHAALSLTGERVQVALWAEDVATADDLSARREDLRAALQDEGLSAEVSVRDGAPPVSASATPAAGQLMDTAV